jgi:hypothetical protein
MADLTQQALQHVIDGLHAALVRDMRDAAQPIEKRLDQLDHHLRELNGKVATHAASLAAGRERFKGLQDTIARIETERRGSGRRAADHHLASDPDARPITKRDVAMFVAGCALMVAIVAMIYRVLPALRALGGP